jgi:hypothetical protein
MQWLYAKQAGVKPNQRVRSPSQERIAHSLRTTPGGFGGDAAPDFFYADGRDLFAEISEMHNGKGKSP